MNPYRYLPSSALAWHPVHETILASGGSEGAILMWDVGYGLCACAQTRT